jgi:hypothetical protein
LSPNPKCPCNGEEFLAVILYIAMPIIIIKILYQLLNKPDPFLHLEKVISIRNINSATTDLIPFPPLGSFISKQAAMSVELFTTVTVTDPVRQPSSMPGGEFIT